MIASSPRLDDLLAVAQAWRQLPSALALRYMPELRRQQVTPADLFMFDLAATARWADLRREREREQQDGRRGGKRKLTARSEMRPGAVRETDADLAIRGNEIPPWDARYKAKRA